MNKWILLAALLVALIAQPIDDEVIDPPGMFNVSRIYSGYLPTTSPKRQIHYVLVESQNSPLKDPLVLWLNGGPGCSSIEGFLHEIGPFSAGNDYKPGYRLKANPYSWSRNANLLFFESPADVGYSINEESGFQWDDKKTADDAFAALYSFIKTKGNIWAGNTFYITGESYAGKYIPDLAVRILDSNMVSSNVYINLQGIMIGNGVMSFYDDSLTKASIQYLIDHDFITPHLQEVYTQSCIRDWNSPRCSFFKEEYDEIRLRLNHYNVYQVCRTNPQITALFKALNMTTMSEEDQLRAIEECGNSLGMIYYMRSHKQQYNIKSNRTWTNCANIKYNIDLSGSLEQYKRLLLNDRVKIWLYNGDADDVVPFEDTLRNLELLKVYPIGAWTPWNVGEYHAGFYQLYRRMTVITVKGAGHMVPEDKREAAFQMFYNFIKNRPLPQPVY